MDEKSPKRIQTHFDEEIFLYPNGIYYYRGTPEWLNKQFELASFVGWVKDEQEKSGKSMSGSTKEFVDAAEKFLKSREFKR